MNPILSTILSGGIPTLAVLIAIIRNESAIKGLEARITSLEHGLEARITSLEQRLDARIETLDRDLREWAKITMVHNTEIARLKDKAGLE